RRGRRSLVRAETVFRAINSSTEVMFYTAAVLSALVNTECRESAENSIFDHFSDRACRLLIVFVIVRGGGGSFLIAILCLFFLRRTGVFHTLKESFLGSLERYLVFRISSRKSGFIDSLVNIRRKLNRAPAALLGVEVLAVLRANALVCLMGFKLSGSPVCSS